MEAKGEETVKGRIEKKTTLYCMHKGYCVCV